MADDDMAAALEYVQARMKTVSVDWFQNMSFSKGDVCAPTVTYRGLRIDAATSQEPVVSTQHSYDINRLVRRCDAGTTSLVRFFWKCEHFWREFCQSRLSFHCDSLRGRAWDRNAYR
jgi:hypothetical protein